MFSNSTYFGCVDLGGSLPRVRVEGSAGDCWSHIHDIEVTSQSININIAMEHTSTSYRMLILWVHTCISCAHRSRAWVITCASDVRGSLSVCSRMGHVVGLMDPELGWWILICFDRSWVGLMDRYLVCFILIWFGGSWSGLKNLDLVRWILIWFDRSWLGLIDFYLVWWICFDGVSLIYIDLLW